MDYTQYASWQKVQLPNGESVYVIPGHPGYCLDVNATNASGRPVIRPNPTKAISEQEQHDQEVQAAKDQQDKAVKQNMFNGSPFGQILPIAAGTGGIIAAAQLAPKAVDPLSQAMATIELHKAGLDTAALANSGGGVTPTLSGAASQGAFFGPGGSATGVGAEFAPTVTGEAPAAVLPATEGAGLASGYGIGLGPLAAVAAGTYLGGKSAYDEIRGKTDNSIPGLIGRGTLGIATGGLSEIARPFLQHKSVADRRADNWTGLADQGIPGAQQAYDVSQNLGDLSGKITSGAHKGEAWSFQGALDQMKEDPSSVVQFQDVYGNYKTFGNEWDKYDSPTKVKITQALIDNNLYDSKDGDVIVTDEAKAKQIRDNILKSPGPSGMNVAVPGGPPSIAPQPGPLSMAAAAGSDNRVMQPPPNLSAAAANDNRVIIAPAIQPARTTTRSPGIGLNGKPMVYWGR